MRGNLALAQLGYAERRSIPAYAGEPAAGVCQTVWGQVYPRVCGGTPARQRPGRRYGGLSPRMRGNPDSTWLSTSGWRSIPAYAGEPKRWGCGGAAMKVYPRVCGGTPVPCRMGMMPPGLSPRMRGNRPANIRFRYQRRSIPAYAGEPGFPAGIWTTRKVYPRVCGGTYNPDCLRVRDEGLSPRMRGNRLNLDGLCAAARSIPAYAGEPDVSSSDIGGRTVYPRVCGGTPTAPMMYRWPMGLSPRMRGNQGRTAGTSPSKGSIPAYAGEPPTPLKSAWPTWVYPRVCGGTRR